MLTPRPRPRRLALRKGKRIRQTTSCPCPTCGKRTRVLRTSRGERMKHGLLRDYVLRERLCIGTTRHRFWTEERAR